MRTVIVVIYLILYYIFSIPAWIVGWVIGKINPDMKPRYAQTLIRRAFKDILFISGVKVTVKGQENILQGESAMYAFNHRSYFDIVMGYTTVPAPTGFIAKKEMIGIPLLSQWMVQMNCLFLDRSNIKEGLKTILTGIEKVKGGISMWIFPEGTRNKSEDPADLMEFHEGSLKIAEKSGCPVIPVAITGTDDVFERHIPWIRKSHVIIEYGEPIYLKELPLDKKKFPGAYTREIISEMIKKQQQERAGK